MDKMSLSERITYSTAKVCCKIKKDGQELISTGTGFIMYLCQDDVKSVCIPVLITNKHVVDGSYSTSFELCLRDEHNTPCDTETLAIEYSGNPWIYHPNNNVDLACLPIGSSLNELEKKGIHLFYVPLTKDLMITPGYLDITTAAENIIMVGYPKGLSDTYNHKPIIRQGITASHIKKDYLGKKEFLMDIASFHGSSGSPIFILNEGIYKDINGHMSIGSHIAFIGILYAAPRNLEKGILQFDYIPSLPTPILDIPINLGIAIKAEEILAFEPILSQLNITETNNG